MWCQKQPLHVLLVYAFVVLSNVEGMYPYICLCHKFGTIYMKQIPILLCVMLLGTAVFGQRTLLLRDFSFSSYTQNGNAKAIDYQKFVSGSKNAVTLPSTDLYSNALTSTEINQRGLSFSFDFNLMEDKNSLPHYFNLNFRNGFIQSVRAGEDANRILELQPSAADQPSYNMLYRAENFGMGAGYRYRLLNHKRLRFYAGLGIRLDVPISSKLEANPVVSATTDTTSNTGREHIYFLEQKTSFYLLPKLVADVQLTKNLAINANYSMGMWRNSIANAALLARTSVFEIGLKFNLK